MDEQPLVHHFFDEATSTLSYVVQDPFSQACAIIDSVLNLDYASGTISFESADEIIRFVQAKDLSVEWILETHVHADHLSAAPYLKARLGGRVAIGANITSVQAVFGKVFAAEQGFCRDGSQFDVLFAEGDRLSIGAMTGFVMHTPGHTPACLTYVIGDAAFVGDTLFMPDYGSARCDFPGGDAGTLYESVRRILDLPDETRIFVCHDYRPGDRALAWESSVAEQRAANMHLRDAVTREEFVAMRSARDATLPMPDLMLPSLQINMRAGHVPPAEGGERHFLKIPLNAFRGPDLTTLSA